MNSDVRDLLCSLQEESAEFLVIGGYAVIHYTEPRYTKDLDVLIGSDLGNGEKVFRALAKFGAPLIGVTAADLCLPGNFFLIGVPPNRIDIIATVPGIDFSSAYARRVEVQSVGLRFPLIGLEDLINCKLAAGRPQDLVDAGLLAKARTKVN